MFPSCLLRVCCVFAALFSVMSLVVERRWGVGGCNLGLGNCRAMCDEDDAIKYQTQQD